MSALPPQAYEELIQLLHHLQSADNSVRTQAEEHLAAHWTSLRPGELLMGLAELAEGDQDTSTRTFAAVIFKRIALKTCKNDHGDTVDLYYSVHTKNAQQAEAIRTKLLQAFTNESERVVRNKISYAVAEIARQHFENLIDWSELPRTLVQLSQVPDSEYKRESAYKVFQATPMLIEGGNVQEAIAVFKTGIEDTDTVSLAAMEAFAAFFRNTGDEQRNACVEVIQTLLGKLQSFAQAEDEDTLSRGLMVVVELAETAPFVFQRYFSVLVNFSISIIGNKSFEDLCRQNALELMATFADYAPSMCRKDENYARSMIDQCLSMMADLGEDDDDAALWLANGDDDGDESDQNHVAGEQTMDRLANHLGGNTIWEPTLARIGVMKGGSWREQHAALMAISSISEGCHDQMENVLKAILEEIVIPFLKPKASQPNELYPARVRWAGCNALGQMSTDFAPEIQENHHELILGALIPVLGHPEARVKSHAAAALVNFCEGATRDMLVPVLPRLLEGLLGLLNNNEPNFVQEQALSTIATVATAAEDAFTGPHENLLSGLLAMLQERNAKEDQLIRAKAMECATMIALAVGKQTLGGNFAKKLVDALQHIQENIVDADDPQAQYLMHSWGRMCRVLESDFVPFLEPVVLPPLLKMGMAKADLQLVDDEEQTEIAGDDDWELIPFKGKMIGIRTSTMDDKHRAIELLALYAQVLKADFAPYVAQIMETIALPGLAFFFHDPVRYAAARLIPELLSSYKARYGAQSNELYGLWNASIDKLLEVLTAEPAIDTLAEMYQCFYESVECVGKNCLSQEHMQKFIAAVKSALDDYKNRDYQRAQKKASANQEFAEEEEEEDRLAVEEDETLLGDMNKAFHAIFKNHGAAFLPAWQNLLDDFKTCLSSNSDTNRQWSLCIIDDLVEYCGPESIKHFDLISGALLDGCKASSSSVRQAAAYGIGVAAQHGGPQWSEFLSKSIEPLFGIVDFPDARSEENAFATENACAAIAKIMHYQPGAVASNPQGTVDMWLRTLPVTNDDEAAPHAYGFLAELIEQQNPSVMNADAAAVLFYAVAQAVEKDMLKGQTASKVCEATKAMLSATGVDPMPLLQQRFNEEAQNAIVTFFQ